MMGLAGPPSEVLFDVNSSHQSGMDSCFSRMVVRRIHCNEWTGWAEQVSRRGSCFFFLVFLIPSLSCFYFSRVLPFSCCPKGWCPEQKQECEEDSEVYCTERSCFLYFSLGKGDFPGMVVLFCFESTAMAFNV